MTDIAVDDLTAAATPLAGTEIAYVVQSGNSRRTTTQDIADLATADETSYVAPSDGGLAVDNVQDAIDALYYDKLSRNDEDQVLQGGYSVVSKNLGTIASGTLTPDPGDRPMQHYTNNGAHTLAPGAVGGHYLLDITNAASAGAITTAGWTKVAGDSFTTTNGHKFRCHCSIGQAGSLLDVRAMQ